MSKQKRHCCKKALAVCLGMSLCSMLAEADGDVLFNLHPYIGRAFSSNINALPVSYGYGIGAQLIYRTPSSFEFFVGADYISLPRETETEETLSNAALTRGIFGTGYYVPLSERVGLSARIGAGVYSLSVADEAKTSLSVTGGVSFVYRVNPKVSVETPVAVGFNSGVLADVGLAEGVSVNLTEAFSSENKISMEVKELFPVFPVLYSWYEKNKFASIDITNEEDASLTDVTVSFFQPQYMTNPHVCATKKKVAKDETFSVDLMAFFNEQMLELIERTDTNASVTVAYSVLGQKKSKTFPITIGVYGRNAMSWDDDRRAAVFVSSRDPAAMLFGKYVTSIVRNNLRNGIPLNIQYAMGIFESLDEFGIGYVIDPSSAYADNVGSTSIDFLQFPYQTLMYRGGDCDDLSILVCSLFEAVGIQTAFITIPGHIFMAFNAGVHVRDADKYFNSQEEYINVNGSIWIPLEITLSDEGYSKAWRVGAREWYMAAKSGEAQLYKMHDSWQQYHPVSVPGAQVKFSLPEKQQIARRFESSIDALITRGIGPQIDEFQRRLAIADTATVRNDFGVLYAKYGLFTEAETQFQKARAQGFVPALLNTANLYYGMQEYDKALQMYNQVLAVDAQNELALVGVARCAYELQDYALCDASYTEVKKNAPELAYQYAYLGSFNNNAGRSFSLAERLENTVWLLSEDKPLYARLETSAESFLEKTAPKKPSTAVTVEPAENAEPAPAQPPELALVPAPATAETQLSSAGGGEEPQNADAAYDTFVSAADVLAEVAGELAGEGVSFSGSAVYDGPALEKPAETMQGLYEHLELVRLEKLPFAFLELRPEPELVAREWLSAAILQLPPEFELVKPEPLSKPLLELPPDFELVVPEPLPPLSSQ